MTIKNKGFEDGDGIPTDWTLTTAGTDNYAEFSSFGGGVESFYWGWPTENHIFDWTELPTSPKPAEFDGSVNPFETWMLQWIETWEHAGGISAYFNGKLHYDNQLGNFTAGLWITGAISGNTAKIVADEDHGVFGELTLINVSGPFDNNEQITDTGAGDALVDISAAYIGEDAFDSFEKWEWFTTIPGPITAMFGIVNPFESFENTWWTTLPGSVAAQFDDKWGGGGALQPYEDFEP